jgi:pimeloyl-ACP methyl ester carboxylesterase
MRPVPRRFDTPFPANERGGPETLSAEGRAAYEALERAQAASPPLDQRQLCELSSKFFAYYLVGNPANSARVESTCAYENELPQNLDRHLGFHFADIQKRDSPVEPFRALRTPTLIIHGTLDRNAPYGAGREWARTLPDARLITVAGGAHNVWIDDPTVVSAADEFLDGKWPARAERIAP